MKKNEKSDQEISAKYKETEVKVMGSSVLYKTDNKNKNLRVTTVYGPNSPGINAAKKDFSDGFFEYSHPEFENRPKRLDLISNRLNRVQLKINGSTSNLCDISDLGFSYAKRLSKIPGDYYHLKKVVASSEKKLVGQKVNATFQSEEENSVQVVNVSGTVRNVKLVCGLLLSEAELEFKNFLYRKTISRNNDKLDVYKKLDYLVDLVKKEIEEGSWSDELAVSVNTTILNMMLEIGTTQDAVDKMYEGYNARPRFIKFGAEVDDQEQAEKLQNLTRSISTIYRKKIEKEKKASQNTLNAKKSIKNVPDIPVEIDFCFQKFLMKSWYGCLARFGLDYQTENLKSNNHSLIKHLKKEARAFDDILERLPEKTPNQINLKATELIITEGIMRGLDKREDLKFGSIEPDIRIIVRKTFELCIREFIAKL